MSSILTLLNDTRAVLNATRTLPEELLEIYEEEGIERTGLDVELGRFFSLSGYNTCRLFGVSKDNCLYRVTTFTIDGQYYCEVSIKSNFEFDHKVFEDPSTYDTTAKIKDNSVELEKVHRDIFIKTLQIEEYDVNLRFGEKDELPQLVHHECVSIYSPLLGF